MKHILTRGIFFAPPDDDGGAETKEVHISDAAKDFAKRFAPPVDGIPNLPKVEEPVLTDEQKVAAEKQESDKQASAEERRREDPRLKKPPGSNVPAIIEAKRKAEGELGEVRGKLAEYETKTVPELNTKITELQAKIDSGNFSAAKEIEFQKKVDKLEADKLAMETDLKKDLETTRRRLSMYSVSDDPIYKEKYLKPLGESIGSLNDIVGENAILKQGLSRAIMAQKASLAATTQSERLAAEDERDTILSQMIDGMDTVKGRRMSSAFDAFMSASENQALALADHEKTAMELRKEAEQRFKDGAKQAVTEWTTEFDRQGVKFDPEMEIGDKYSDKIKELGIKLDVKADNDLARGAIEGRLKKEEVVTLIQRGRAFNVLNAKLKAAEALLADHEALVVKLRGAGGGGGGRSGNQVQTKDVNSDGKTREEWQRSRFAPPRA